MIINKIVIWRKYIIPEVLGLKLMSLNACYNCLLTINHFPIYLQNTDMMLMVKMQLTMQTFCQNVLCNSQYKLQWDSALWHRHWGQCHRYLSNFLKPFLLHKAARCWPLFEGGRSWMINDYVGPENVPDPSLHVLWSAPVKTWQVRLKNLVSYIFFSVLKRGRNVPAHHILLFWQE